MGKLWICVMVCMSASVFTGCADDKNTNSNIPKIAMLDEYVVPTENNYDSALVFNVSYSDNDGDIGLQEWDTMGDFAYKKPAFYNFFCWIYVKTNGTWSKPLNPFGVNDTLQFHERLPYLTPSGKYKQVQGDILMTIPARPYGLKLDTVKFEFLMMDRALNRSNSLFSKEIRLKHP